MRGCGGFTSPLIQPQRGRGNREAVVLGEHRLQRQHFTHGQAAVEHLLQGRTGGVLASTGSARGTRAVIRDNLGAHRTLGERLALAGGDKCHHTGRMRPKGGAELRSIGKAGENHERGVQRHITAGHGHQRRVGRIAERFEGGTGTTFVARVANHDRDRRRVNVVQEARERSQWLASLRGDDRNRRRRSLGKGERLRGGIGHATGAVQVALEQALDERRGVGRQQHPGPLLGDFGHERRQGFRLWLELVSGDQDHRRDVSQLQRRVGEEVSQGAGAPDEQVRGASLEHAAGACGAGNRDNGYAVGGSEEAKLAGDAVSGFVIGDNDQQLHNSALTVDAFKGTRGALGHLGPVGGEEMGHICATYGSGRFAFLLSHCYLRCQWRGVRRRDILHLQLLNLASGTPTCPPPPTIRLKMSSTTPFVPSANIAQLRESATIAVSQKAKALKAAGRTIIDLGAGEPDFDTPAFIRQAAVDALDAGATRYTPVDGILPLRQVIADQANARYAGADRVMATDVVVSTGSKQSLYNACVCLFGPGDEVLVPTPAWTSYYEMVGLARATPIAVLGDPSNGYKVSPSMLEAHATARTKGIMLNSPSNPTGSVYAPQELRAILELAARRGWYVISDEIYQRIAYERPAVSALDVATVRDRLVVINGVAKAYAMTGWRIGWSVSSAAVAKAMTAFQSHTTSNAATVSQHAALAALARVDESDVAVTAMVAAFRTRRDAALAILREEPRIEVLDPQGAFYLFLRAPAAPGGTCDGDAFCARLLDQVGLAIVPGSAFRTPDWVRVSYATDQADVERAMHMLVKTYRAVLAGDR